MILTGLQILIADDEPALREILMEELQDRGATVTCVEDGNQAWKALLQKRFDVVVSDVRMPGGNGIELIKKISNELKIKPVVFLYTGYADLSIDEAKKHGVVEIFAKPFNITHMVQVIADSFASTQNKLIKLS